MGSTGKWQRSRTVMKQIGCKFTSKDSETRQKAKGAYVSIISWEAAKLLLYYIHSWKLVTTDILQTIIHNIQCLAAHIPNYDKSLPI